MGKVIYADFKQYYNEEIEEVPTVGSPSCECFECRANRGELVDEEKQKWLQSENDSLNVQLEEILRLVGMTRREWDLNRVSYEGFTVKDFLFMQYHKYF